MIEHLLIILAQQWSEKEQARRQEAEAKVRAVANALRRDSGSVLLHDAVTIPAMTNPIEVIVLSCISSAIVLGALVVACIVLRDVLDLKWNFPNWVALALLIGFLALSASVTYGLYRLYRHVLRGGELTIQRTHAEFHFRGEMVRCPWALFRTAESFHGNNKRVIVPINVQAAERVEMLKGEGIIANGRDAQLKSFRFVSGTEVELRNVYAAKLRDVAQLLQDLGRRLG